MGVSSGCHFFLNVNRIGVSSSSYFFSYMNRIKSVVELKIYIKVQKILGCRKNLSEGCWTLIFFKLHPCENSNTIYFRFYGFNSEWYILVLCLISYFKILKVTFLYFGWYILQHKFCILKL